MLAGVVTEVLMEVVEVAVVLSESLVEARAKVGRATEGPGWKWWYWGLEQTEQPQFQETYAKNEKLRGIYTSN